jgi:2-polyprenyl-3-methyl-5-hydroxy-6-metoxy-1,4-benzoquinol methylase
MLELLKSLSLIDEKSIEEYFPEVRDRSDISVRRCTKSGIIFLSRTDHVDTAYYEDKDRAPEVDKLAEVRQGDKVVRTPRLDDARRRAEWFSGHTSGRKWLDFGTGAGDILSLLAPEAQLSVGVEPNAMQRNDLRQRGFEVHPSLDDVTEKTFDVATLFHVFEHLKDPIATLGDIRSRIKPGGSCIIEVPHARDALFQTLDCEAFKKFTFWSEHLILHTRNSLEAFIREAGFKEITILGYQRYPLSNHLYWLRHAKPGGHEKWSFLNTQEILDAYQNTLRAMDQTDTLIAIAKT